MHPAIQGAIVGAVIGLFLILFEYIMLKKAVDERAKRYHRKAEFDQTEKKRIHTVLRFALILPIGFAAGAWLIFQG
ncbi:MAG: hypothetical protein ACT4P4_17290 [Betaproteobacteria bacterium]